MLAYYINLIQQQEKAQLDKRERRPSDADVAEVDGGPPKRDRINSVSSAEVSLKDDDQRTIDDRLKLGHTLKNSKPDIDGSDSDDQVNKKSGRPSKHLNTEDDNVPLDTRPSKTLEAEVEGDEETPADREEVRRKPGRPPKKSVDEEEGDDQTPGDREEVRRKPGRPPKKRMVEVSYDEREEVHRKPGRPSNKSDEEIVRRRPGRPPRQKSEPEEEESDVSDDDEVGGKPELVRRKPGRPPKLPSPPDSGEDVRRKPGRPPKVQIDESSKKAAIVVSAKSLVQMEAERIISTILERRPGRAEFVEPLLRGNEPASPIVEEKRRPGRPRVHNKPSPVGPAAVALEEPSVQATTAVVPNRKKPAEPAARKKSEAPATSSEPIDSSSSSFFKFHHPADAWWRKSVSLCPMDYEEELQSALAEIETRCEEDRYKGNDFSIKVIV